MRWFVTCSFALILTAGPLLAQNPPPGTVPPGYPMPTRSMDFKELIPPLLDALKDGDADVRQSAAGALAAIGRDAVAPLLKVYEDKEKDKDTRAGIAFVFGQMGVQGREALPALTKSLKDKEEDKDVRRKAVAAIALIVKDVAARGHAPYGSYPPAYYTPIPAGAPGLVPVAPRAVPPPPPPPDN